MTAKGKVVVGQAAQWGLRKQGPRALLHPSKLCLRGEAFKQGKAPKKCRGLPNSNATPPKMQTPSKAFKQYHQDMMKLDLLKAKERKTCGGCSLLYQ